MRIGEACRAAAAQLRTAGVPDPAWDSGQLMSRATGLAPLMARLSERELTAEEAAAFDALVQRRLQREPLQYILGTQDFCGRSFAVDGRVLIPRPETELLAERAVRALQDFGPGAHALDLCCGSGCLGITLALEAPSAQVDMADLSEDALAVTRKNADRLGAQTLTPEVIPCVTELDEHRYVLPAVTKTVEVFRGERFNEKELERQLTRSGSFTRLLHAKSALDSTEKHPLLPLSIGQIGLIGGSGMINGLIECDTPHIIKGRIVKVKNVEREEQFDQRGNHIGAEVHEVVSNKMIFNVLTPNGFLALS